MGYTQNLLIFIIAFNLLTGAIMEFAISPTATQSSSINNFISDSQTFGGQVQNESAYSVPQSATYIEPTFGSGISMGKKLFDVFLKGITPIALQGTTPSNNLEQVFLWGLQIFQGVMYMMILLEAYLVFKNRKSS